MKTDNISIPEYKPSDKKSYYIALEIAIDSIERLYNEHIEKFSFEVIHTPGHADDSVVIYFKDDSAMFVGDFIFKNGVGRTDLGGNYYDLVNSIKKISKYNKSITIYPGHGDYTKLGIEINKLMDFI